MQDNNNKENDLFIVGGANFENGQYKEAIKNFSELIKLNPKNYNGLCCLGESYCENGEYDKAIEPLLKAVELKPNDYRILALLGKSYSLNNQYIEAIKYLLKAYKLNPKEFDCWDLLWESYSGNGEYDKAIETLLKVIELNPDELYNYWELGWLYEKNNQKEEAFKSFMKTNYHKNWVNFYIEFANKLINYKNNRIELIEILKSISNINFPKTDDIDPFTVFGLLNGQGWDFRENMIKYISDKFKMASKLTEWHWASPYYFNFNRIFYNPSKNDKKDIENLWNFFEDAINYADNNTNENREKFIKAYNVAKDIKGNKWKLTIGLHWIRPFNYINLDITSRRFIIENNIIPDYANYLSDKSIINGEEYLTICDKLIEAIKNDKYQFKDLLELSFFASITGYTRMSTYVNENSNKSVKKEGNIINIENNFNNSNKYDKKDFLQEVYITENEYNKLVKLITEKKNIILQGSAGVGKTYAAKRLAYSIIGEIDKARVKMIQFHQSYSYEDFIMGYRPNENGFELKEGVFYNFCKEAEEDEGNKYFLIIDEINRGNISKIFGELFMLIENDKRGEGEALELIYKEDEKFFVPENLYIIGLMNTADRSLAMLDYALRRRFAFYDMKPAFDSEQFKEYQKKLNNKKFDSLIEKVKELNQEILEDGSLGEGFCIGHSYFCNLETIKDDKLSLIIEFELIPLLKEYWFDDKEKVNKWETELRNSIK